MPATPITSPQKRKIAALVSEATEKVIEEMGLDKEGAQWVIEMNGDEFAAAVREKVRELLTRLSVSDQFADEEVASNYGYLSGYKQPKGITEQTNRLRELIRGVGFADEKLAELPLPKLAEGFFAIPKWETVAPTYGEAVQKVQDLLRAQRGGKFYSYREGQLGPLHLRQSARSVAFWKRLADAQKGYDILVVPAQFGKRDGISRSVRRSRVVFTAQEFGLGAFASGIMLLTHPERLQHYDDLWIDCAGDEYAPGADDQFVNAPYFYFDVDGLEFDAFGVGSYYDFCGSASAFSPE